MSCLSSILVTMMFNIKPFLNMISLCRIHSTDSEVNNRICVKEFPPQGSCQEKTSSTTITTKGQGFHKNKARILCWPLWSLHLYHRVNLSWIAEQSWDGRWKDLGFFRAGRWLDPPVTGSGRVSFLIISTRHNNGPVLKVQQGHNRGVLPKDSEKRSSVGSQRFALRDNTTGYRGERDLCRAKICLRSTSRAQGWQVREKAQRLRALNAWDGYLWLSIWLYLEWKPKRHVTLRDSNGKAHLKSRSFQVSRPALNLDHIFGWQSL